MTCHYPDLDSASDWLKEISLATRPDLGSVASGNQCGISALVSQTSFRGKTNDVGCFLRLRAREQGHFAFLKEKQFQSIQT